LVTRVLMGFFALVGEFITPVAVVTATHIVSPGESPFPTSRSWTRDSLIYPGQQLDVPEDSSISRTSVTVKAEERLYRIGPKKAGAGHQEIMSANGLYNSDNNPGIFLHTPTVSGINTEPQPVSQVSRGGHFQRPTPADVDLLARLITAEANGEPYEGKVAVGAVVLNRVAAPDFPNSIPDVIYEHSNGTYQFEPVKNGRINRPASAESIRAAKDALNGRDPTKGAVYFSAAYIKNSTFSRDF